eukprot:m.854214 g.854214  ORF g.854214 m.854214 type:complete len:834 (-) comp23502_c2_seq2:381-2882(-)
MATQEYSYGRNTIQASLPECLAEPVPSLQTLCSKVIATLVAHGTRITCLPEVANQLVLEHLSSNREITDVILECFSRRSERCTSPEEDMDIDDDDDTRTWGSGRIQELRWLNLSRNIQITLNGLAAIMSSHKIEHLDLSYLGNLVHILPKCETLLGPYLKTLRVAGCCLLHPGARIRPLLAAPDSVHPAEVPINWNFPRLQTLDLTSTDIRGMDLLSLPETLRILSLRGALVTPKDLEDALYLPNLISLDISRTFMQFRDCEWTLFEKHPHLQYLDISHCPDMMTRFDIGDDARAMFFDKMTTHGKDLRWVNLCQLNLDGTCISKLRSLPRLEFLGLCGTPVFEEEIAEWDRPVRVAAVFTKEQLVIALKEVGMKDDECAKDLLRHLFEMVCPDRGNVPFGAQDPMRLSCDTGGIITEAVVDILEKYEEGKPNDGILLLATANLFYLTTKHMDGQTPRARLRALRAMLVLLERLILRRGTNGEGVAKNCTLAMRNFRLEGELSRCARFVAIALLRAALKYTDRALQHTALLLCCHNLASLHPRHKLSIGSAEPEGGINLVLRLITDQHAALLKLETPEAADFVTLELCWTFLWNITDETPRNVARFIAHAGIDTMLCSLETFPTVVALRRNVMGLVTNIAEVPACRTELMQERVLQLLHTCLVDGPNDLEVAYNVAGTLCHVLSDGEAFWLACGRTPELRRCLLSALATAVGGWTMAIERWINYRSLTPIVRLLQPSLEEEVHMWATWALASLCMVDRDKYCAMCAFEGVVDALEQLQCTTPGPSAWVRERIAITLALCRDWSVEHQANTAILAGHMDCRSDRDDISSSAMVH